MSKQIERRYITHEFRVASDSGKPKIQGYAALFGVRSDPLGGTLGGWVEVIAPDAFDASLASNPDVRALFNHDPNLILGRTASGTLKLTKDATGLAYEIDPPDTQVARDLIVSMDRGDISQSSFGFICMNASWGYDEVNGVEVRTIKEAILFDVSPVTYPAYLDTTSQARSMPADMPVEVRSRIAARKPDTRDNAAGCGCDCGQCVAGSCEICSNDDCSDELCSCQEQRSLRNANANLKLAIELAMADE